LQLSAIEDGYIIFLDDMGGESYLLPEAAIEAWRHLVFS
jgi:hypothetical protein